LGKFFVSCYFDKVNGIYGVTVWPENICRPQELSLTCEISRKKINSLSKFPQFSLTPDPNNSHEKSEWGNFLNYLCKNDKVCCSVFSCLNPFILYVLVFILLYLIYVCDGFV